MISLENALIKYSVSIAFFMLCLVWTHSAHALAISDRVQADGTVNVRTSAAGAISGTQSGGRLGTITAGPVNATLNGTSYTWWSVNWDSGVDGWVADIGLIRVAPVPPLAVSGISSGYTSSSLPYQPSISLTGTNLNSITEISWSCRNPNGSNCAAITPWTISNWSGKFTRNSNTSASVQPILLALGDVAGTYSWTVVFSGGGQSVSRHFTVTYNPPAPAVLAVSGISSSYTSSSLPYQPSITLTGANLNLITEIRWSCRNPNGSNCAAISPWTTSNWSGKFARNTNASASVQPTLLALGDVAGTYSWTVVFSGGGQSVSRQFSVVYNPPSPAPVIPVVQVAPVLSVPANGAVTVTSAPTLSWSAVAGASRYWVMVASSASQLPTDPAAKTCVSCIVSAITDVTSHTVGAPPKLQGRSDALSPGLKYFWKVQGYSDTQNGAFSSVRSFTTPSGLAPPASVEWTVDATESSYSSSMLPFNKQIHLTGTHLNLVTEIQWSCTNPDGKACGNITPWRASDSNWRSKFVLNATNSVATVNPRLLTTGDVPGIYSWTVMFTGGGQSVIRKFEVVYTGLAITKPSVPAYLFPGDLSEPGPRLDSVTSVRWNSANSATRYFGTIQDVDSGLVVVQIDTSNSSREVVLPAGRKYKWSVYSCNENSCSDLSEESYFQINALAAKPDELLKCSLTSTSTLLRISRTARIVASCNTTPETFSWAVKRINGTSAESDGLLKQTDMVSAVYETSGSGLFEITYTASNSDGQSSTATINIQSVTPFDDPSFSVSTVDFSLEGGGAAHTYVDVRPGTKAIVIAHGWNSDASSEFSWVFQMAKSVCEDLGINKNLIDQYQAPQRNALSKVCGINFTDVWVIDWHKWSSLDDEGWLPRHAYRNAENVAPGIALKLYAEGYSQIHLLGHSAGSNLIHQITKHIKINLLGQSRILNTFLDAYDPNAKNSVSAYGAHSDWADNYIDYRNIIFERSSTKVTLPHAYNIDVTGYIDNGYDGCQNYRIAAICRHSRPYRFYGKTVNGSIIGDQTHNQVDPLYAISGPWGYPLSKVPLSALQNNYKKGEGCGITSSGQCEPGFVPANRSYDLTDPVVIFDGLVSIKNIVVTSAKSVIDLIIGTGEILFELAELGGPQSTIAPSNLSALGFGAQLMETDASSWISIEVTTDTPSNTLRFNRTFSAGEQGVLRVFVNDYHVKTIDSSYVSADQMMAEEAFVGGDLGYLPPGTHQIAFRWDDIGSRPTNISVTDAELWYSDFAPASANLRTIIDGGDRTVADSDARPGELVTMKAVTFGQSESGSYPEWLVNNLVVAAGASASLNLPDGKTVVTFRTKNAIAQLSTTSVTITVAEHRPPSTVFSQRQALENIYVALKGDNWIVKTNWMSPEISICSWHGVVCANDEVVSINLPNNNLNGIMPAEFAQLHSLNSLNLWGNQLSGKIPTELGQLSNLTYLNLIGNQLGGSIPSELSHLKKLTNLLLQRNQLTGTLPLELGRLESLVTLSLGGNQLTGTIPNELGRLNNLTFLDLQGNQLTGSIPRDLALLNNLTSLDLQGNQLSGPIPADIGLMNNLTRLALAANKLTGPIPAELRRLTNLTDLNFCMNQLTGSIPAELGQLSKLNVLSLCGNQLTGKIPAELGLLSDLTALFLNSNQLTGTIPVELMRLAKLTSLSLGINGLSGSIPAELGQLSNLTQLSLCANQLTGSIPVALGQLRNLTSLDLSGNQLTGEMPAELKNLSELRALYLQNNRLTGAVPNSLEALPFLTAINVSGQRPDLAVLSVDTSSRNAVQDFYKTVYASSENVPSGWNGNIAVCNAGETSHEYKGAILRRINWFRAMAGVPDKVQFDPVYNQYAQQAALIMAANNQLSHMPSQNWLCYNQTGSNAAANSNLNLGAGGPESIDAYIRDAGDNNASVGHRRWILYPPTQFMGTGDVVGTTSSNALWVFDLARNVSRSARDEFVSWPPKGYVPYQVVYPRWSFSYPYADFQNATVTMQENGRLISTRVETAENGPGENTLVWLLAGDTSFSHWQKPSQDTTYSVTVANVVVAGEVRSFDYEVIVFDPLHASADPGSKPVVSIVGGNRTVSDSNDRPGETVTMIATASETPITSAQWLVGGQVVATGTRADLSLDDGTTVVTFRAADSSGSTLTTSALIIVESVSAALTDWLGSFNSVVPDAAYGLETNSIGLILTERARLHSCVRIFENSEPAEIGDSHEFDITFNIVSIDNGIIQLIASRPVPQASQRTDALLGCSGTFESTTGIYRDFVKLGAQLFDARFRLTDDVRLEFTLTSATEVNRR